MHRSTARRATRLDVGLPMAEEPIDDEFHTLHERDDEAPACGDHEKHPSTIPSSDLRAAAHVLTRDPDLHCAIFHLFFRFLPSQRTPSTRAETHDHD